MAGWWLRLKGWSILARRVKTKAGEIDLIARKPGLVIFVEVKSRATDTDLDLSIDERRLARVARAAESVSHDYLQPGDDMQIDVILLAPGRIPRHLSNVWMGG